MSKLQLKELNINDRITSIEQAQISGGGAGPHNYIHPSSSRQEELWEGYADGDYYIEIVDRYRFSSGTFVKFYRANSDRDSIAGVIKV